MSRNRKDSDFVYFEDRGTVLDAPIDAVWDFWLTDNEFHTKAHKKTLRNMKWKELNDITGEGNCEVIRGGKWTKMRFRMTVVPPLVRVQEEIGGRRDGQKMVWVYAPKGKRTVVDVFVHTRKEVAGEIRQTLIEAHEEDVPALREFMRARRRVRKS